MGNFYEETLHCNNYFVFSGFIDKITLQIPLSRLHSEPWVISMERLYLVAIILCFSGFIGKITLQIPLSCVHSEPWVISMERLYLVTIVLCFQVHW